MSSSRPRETPTDRKTDSKPSRAQMRQTVVGGERRAELERHAERENLVDLRAQQRARQSVLRDSEAHHSARLAAGFDDRDGVAQQREIVRRGQAGRAGADDRDLALTGFAGELGRQQRTADGKVSGVPIAFARAAFSQPILRVGPNRLDAVLFGDVPLQRANRDRARRCCRDGRRLHRARRRRGRRRRQTDLARGRRGTRPRRGPQRSVERSGRRPCEPDSPSDT